MLKFSKLHLYLVVGKNKIVKTLKVSDMSPLLIYKASKHWCLNKLL